MTWMSALVEGVVEAPIADGHVVGEEGEDEGGGAGMPVLDEGEDVPGEDEGRDEGRDEGWDEGRDDVLCLGL